MNPKGFKFQLEFHIDKVIINTNLQCKMQVILKRVKPVYQGNQKLETQQLAEFNKGKAIINETLVLQTNIYQINGHYQEKKAQLTILLITEKGNKVAGQCNLDLSTYLNDYKHECEVELGLDKCPDKNAKLLAKIRLTEMGEIDFDTLSTASQSTINDQTNQHTQRKASILTPIKEAIENTAKKFLGDSNQISSSSKIDISGSKTDTKVPNSPIISSNIGNSQQQQIQNNNTVQIDIQQLYEELNQQKILQMEIKDANNQLKAEIQSEKVKKESLLLQIQELKKINSQMIDQSVQQELISQYENQISQLQNQIRQLQKENENITLNCKKAMQKNNKTQEEFSTMNIKQEDLQKQLQELKNRIKEQLELIKKKDELYIQLEKSNFDNIDKNNHYEEQIQQLNQTIKLFQNKLNENDSIIQQLNNTLQKCALEQKQQEQENNSLILKQSNLYNQIQQLQQQLKQQENFNNECDQNKLENDNLINSHLKDTESQLNEKIIQCQNYQDQLQTLHNQIQQNYEQYQQQLNQQEQQNLEKILINQKEIDNLKQELQQQNNLESIVKQQQSQSDILQKTLTNMEEQFNNSKNQLDLQFQREQELKEEIKTLTTQLTQLQQLLTDIQSQIDIMKRMFPEQQPIIESQDKIPNQLIELNKLLQLKFQQLKSELTIEQSNIKENVLKQEQSIQVEPQENELQGQCIQCQELKTQLFQIQNKLFENQKQYEQHLSEYQSKQNEIDQKNKEQVNEISYNYDQQIEILKQNQELFENQITELNKQTKLEQNEYQIKILEKDEQLNNIITQCKLQEQQNQKLVIESEQQQVQIQQSNARYQEYIHNSQKEKLQYENEINKLQQQITQLIQENEEIKKQIIENNQKLISQQENLGIQDQKFSQSQQSLNDQKQTIQTMELQVQQLNQQIIIYEKQIKDINDQCQKKIDQNTLENINKVNDAFKQLQQLQQISSNDKSQIIDLKKQIDQNENDFNLKIEKQKLEMQLVHQNYNNRISEQETIINNLKQEIANYQQNEQEQQNLIKFLENVKESLEAQKQENLDYIQKIQLNNEQIIHQSEIQEQEIAQLNLQLQDLNLKIQQSKEQITTLEDEKVNISNHYQQLIEDQSIKQTQENNEGQKQKLELLEDEVTLLKFRIGDMFNAALEFGGLKLVDKLQTASGIKE